MNILETPGSFNPRGLYGNQQATHPHHSYTFVAMALLTVEVFGAGNCPELQTNHLVQLIGGCLCPLLEVDGCVEAGVLQQGRGEAGPILGVVTRVT